ncbi:MAG: hypothetical protein DHS20C15_27330 [Planctomycetota bacterium]|nr:MAG: hypothetical protein DHS20C15_27330 [Planctomycetota bacterium]
MRLFLASLLFACLGAPLSSAQTFVERLAPDDLRVVSYNVLWDTIFPSENAFQAAKFERVVHALDADIWAIQEIDYDTHVSVVLNLMDSIAPIPGGWHGHKEGDSVILSKFPLSMLANDTIPEGDKGVAMALIDLPDDRFSTDLYMMNNHYKCCGGNDHRRQEQSDALVNWMRDIREPGGFITLPAGTAMMVIGDLNLVDGFQPVQTLIDGNIIDNASFGPDSPPDWDASDATDEHPLHNVVGPADWTWYTPGQYDPGRLDFVITTDSVLQSVHRYALNTTTMSAGDLAATGLQATDVTVDFIGQAFDHIPLVIDYREADPWTQLGGALAGATGEPALQGGGLLLANTALQLELSNARPSSSATLVLGMSALNAPLKGGLLVPSPDVVRFNFNTNAAGELDLASTWPEGIPGGLSIWSQWWISDPAGPSGFAASNAVKASAP